MIHSIEKVKVKLIEHNNKDQKEWGSNDDTKDGLKIGKEYDAVKEVHDWHTKIIIGGKKYNSVCFLQV